MQRGLRLDPIRCLPPDLINLPQVCPYSPRCNFVQDASYDRVPPLRPVVTDQRTVCLSDGHPPWLVKGDGAPQAQTSIRRR